MNQTDFKQNLRSVRLKLDYTQEELADVIGISRQAYSALEVGTTAIVSDQILAMAQATGLTEQEILFNFGDNPQMLADDSRTVAYGKRRTLDRKRINELESEVSQLSGQLAETERNLAESQARYNNLLADHSSLKDKYIALLEQTKANLP